MRRSTRLGALAPALALGSALAAVAAAGADEPTPLFDGATLSGWEAVGGQAGTWGVEGGLLVTRGAGGGWLSTAKTYRNFVLSLDYMLEPGGNSGVFIRSPREGDPAYTGMEIQILDDDDARYAKLQPYQYCGSVYGVEPARRGQTGPPGRWNSMEIRAEGRTVTVSINGKVVTTADLDAHKSAVATHPGIERPAGFIGLQSHSEPVKFSKITIRELP